MINENSKIKQWKKNNNSNNNNNYNNNVNKNNAYKRIIKIASVLADIKYKNCSLRTCSFL